MTIEKSSTWYGWLTSAFGKTVVGTKKGAKYSDVCLKISESGWEFTKSECGGVFVTQPIPSEKLQDFTRSKTFRLI
jgi:hypothetical protein